MKSTGIVRKMDSLGRLVIPKELRNVLGISNDDPIEIFTDQKYILLKKYQPSCIFCGEANDVINFEGKNICPACVEKIKAHN